MESMLCNTILSFVSIIILYCDEIINFRCALKYVLIKTIRTISDFTSGALHSSHGVPRAYSIPVSLADSSPNHQHHALLGQGRSQVNALEIVVSRRSFNSRVCVLGVSPLCCP